MNANFAILLVKHVMDQDLINVMNVQKDILMKKKRKLALKINSIFLFHIIFSLEF